MRIGWLRLIICLIGLGGYVFAEATLKSMLAVNRMVISSGNCIDIKSWPYGKFPMLEYSKKGLDDILSCGEFSFVETRESLKKIRLDTEAHRCDDDVKLKKKRFVEYKGSRFELHDVKVNKIFRAWSWGDYLLLMVETAEGLKEMIRGAFVAESISLMIICTKTSEFAVRGFGWTQPQVWILE